MASAAWRCVLVTEGSRSSRTQRPSVPGGPARRADVGLIGAEIAAVDHLADAQAAVTIDCRGKIVTPGFIDIHSHSDWLLPGADHGDSPRGSRRTDAPDSVRQAQLLCFGAALVVSRAPATSCVTRPWSPTITSS